MRGFSAVSLLLIDEAARVSDAIYQALQPMLAVGTGTGCGAARRSGNCSGAGSLAGADGREAD